MRVVIAGIFIYLSVCYLPAKNRCVDTPKGEEKIVQKVNTQPFLFEINSFNICVYIQNRFAP